MLNHWPQFRHNCTGERLLYNFSEEGPIAHEDTELIERLLGHKDQQVRYNAVCCLGRLGESNRQTAKRLALSVDVEGNLDLAKSLFLQFSMLISDLYDLADNEIDILIEKLATIDELDDHFINQFLVIASHRRPLRLFRMLLERIDSFAWDSPRPVNPVPSQEFGPQLDGFSKHSSYIEMLREIRERSLSPSRPGRFYIPRLFREMTLSFSTDYMHVLNEWLVTPEPDKVEAVAFLLREASGFHLCTLRIRNQVA